MSNLNRSNIIISFVLVGVYVYYFGYESLERYLEKATMTTTLQEKDASIIPPSIVYVDNII